MASRGRKEGTRSLRVCFFLHSLFLSFRFELLWPNSGILELHHCVLPQDREMQMLVSRVKAPIF